MVSAIEAAHPDRFILYLDRYFLSQDETYPFVLSEPLPVTGNRLDLTSIENFDAAAGPVEPDRTKTAVEHAGLLSKVAPRWWRSGYVRPQWCSAPGRSGTG
jgi:hypothetical protein